MHWRKVISYDYGKGPKSCCGCWACENVCPKGCIEMREDFEGYRYPVVDAETCTDCGACEAVCPLCLKDHKKESYKESVNAFLAQNRDEKVLRESTSGGAFQRLPIG